MPVPPFMTIDAALVLLPSVRSGVELVTDAVLRIVPTLPDTCDSMTKVTEAPAGTLAEVHRTVWVALV